MGARHAGALVDDVLTEAAQARHGPDEADLRERLLDGILGYAQCVGNGRPLTSCFSSAYSSCVTVLRRHSRSHLVMAGCAAFAAARHAQHTSSSPTIVLFVTPSPRWPRSCVGRGFSVRRGA
jgi:hypothetical protein